LYVSSHKQPYRHDRPNVELNHFDRIPHSSAVGQFAINSSWSSEMSLEAVILLIAMWRTSQINPVTSDAGGPFDKPRLYIAKMNNGIPVLNHIFRFIEL
jgi:hypothetical protein